MLPVTRTRPRCAGQERKNQATRPRADFIYFEKKLVHLPLQSNETYYTCRTSYSTRRALLSDRCTADKPADDVTIPAKSVLASQPMLLSSFAQTTTNQLTSNNVHHSHHYRPPLDSCALQCRRGKVVLLRSFRPLSLQRFEQRCSNRYRCRCCTFPPP
jgi:hypothetical protein